MSGATIVIGLTITLLPLLSVLSAPSLWRFVGLLGYAGWWGEKLAYSAGMRSVRAVRKLRAEHTI